MSEGVFTRPVEHYVFCFGGVFKDYHTRRPKRSVFNTELRLRIITSPRNELNRGRNRLQVAEVGSNSG